jgi:hypothetical protein
MPHLLPMPHSDLEEALGHASNLLQCAAATAYESGDRLTGSDRHLALSVVHLIDMAKMVIDHSLIRLEQLPEAS